MLFYSFAYHLQYVLSHPPYPLPCNLEFWYVSYYNFFALLNYNQKRRINAGTISRSTNKALSTATTHKIPKSDTAGMSLKLIIRNPMARVTLEIINDGDETFMEYSNAWLTPLFNFRLLRKL